MIAPNAEVSSSRGKEPKERIPRRGARYVPSFGRLARIRLDHRRKANSDVSTGSVHCGNWRQRDQPRLRSACCYTKEGLIVLPGPVP